MGDGGIVRTCPVRDCRACLGRLLERNSVATQGRNAMLGTILLVFAFVLACLASYGIPAGRWQLGWAALAFYFLSLLLGAGLHLLR